MQSAISSSIKFLSGSNSDRVDTGVRDSINLGSTLPIPSKNTQQKYVHAPTPGAISLASDVNRLRVLILRVADNLGLLSHVEV